MKLIYYWNSTVKFSLVNTMYIFIAIEMLLIFVCTAGLYGTEIKQYKHRVKSLSHKQYSVWFSTLFKIKNIFKLFRLVNKAQEPYVVTVTQRQLYYCIMYMLSVWPWTVLRTMRAIPGLNDWLLSGMVDQLQQSLQHTFVRLVGYHCRKITRFSFLQWITDQTNTKNNKIK